MPNRVGAQSQLGAWDGRERRVNTWLSSEQIDAIAERAADLAADRAADKVEKRIYEEIGRSVGRAILYALGAAGIAVLGWLGLAGKIKLP